MSSSWISHSKSSTLFLSDWAFVWFIRTAQFGHSLFSIVYGCFMWLHWLYNCVSRSILVYMACSSNCRLHMCSIQRLHNQLGKASHSLPSTKLRHLLYSFHPISWTYCNYSTFTYTLAYYLPCSPSNFANQYGSHSYSIIIYSNIFIFHFFLFLQLALINHPMFEPILLNPTNIYLRFSKYPNVKVYPPGTILLLYRIG